MADFKRYDSANYTEHQNVRLTKDPELKNDGKLVELTFTQTNRLERYEEVVWTTATFRREDKEFGYLLARLAKSDMVTVGGRQALRQYEKTVGTGKAAKKVTVIAAEIPFAKTLVFHGSLKDRADKFEGAGSVEDTGVDDSETIDDADIPF